MERRYRGSASLRAVTILEIAVAITIVALGASLIFPVARNLQKKTTQANCASNLRQLGMAIFNYAASEGGRIPRWNEGQPAAPLALNEYAPTGENAGTSWAQLLVNGNFITDR